MTAPGSYRRKKGMWIFPPVAELVDRLEDDYKMSVKNLEVLMKAHPLWQWGKAIDGIGLKQSQAARRS
jgi:hypothetical protein